MVAKDPTAAPTEDAENLRTPSAKSRCDPGSQEATRKARSQLAADQSWRLRSETGTEFFFFSFLSRVTLVLSFVRGGALSGAGRRLGRVVYHVLRRTVEGRGRRHFSPWNNGPENWQPANAVLITCCCPALGLL